MTHNPVIDLSVVLAFGLVFFAVAYFADKRKAAKQ